jgi:serine/threonine protein phosphatase PrpC
MSIPRRSETFAFEQSPGATSPELAQQDRVRVERVRTSGDLNLILAVVADGEGGPSAGEAAQAVLTQIFKGVSQSTSQDLTSILRDQLHEASRIVSQRETKIDLSVAVTTMAIWRNKLFYAHVGHSIGVLLREGQTLQLTRSTPQLLGDPDQIAIQSSGPKGVSLKPGDRLLLASDGLVRQSPEDGKPFVDPELFADYVGENKPLEAARHLISIAMGRDVDDNVSVVIIDVPGKLPRRRIGLSIRMVGAMIAVLVLAAGIWGITRFFQSGEIRAPLDYGYLVVLQGQVQLDDAQGGGIVGTLGTLPAGAQIISISDNHFTLQTTYEGSPGLEPVSFYASLGTEIRLSMLDPHFEPSGADQPFDPMETALEIVSGRIMTVRGRGERPIKFLWNGDCGSLMGAGEGILGVVVQDRSAIVDCLHGTCKMIPAQSDPFEMVTGQRVWITAGKFDSISNTSSDDFGDWNSLCGGCLQDN